MTDKEKKEECHFPSWRYGPNGAAAVFESEDDVPEGWEDHPSKLPLELDKTLDL